MSEHTQENKIATEVAEAEFERFCVGMDLDVDPAGLDEDDKKSLADSKRRFLTAVEAGRLQVNEACEPVLQPGDGGKPIVFHEPKGSALMATDQKKKGHDMAKTFAAMAAMTGENPGRFADMANRDVKICTAIFGLFMAG